MATSTAKWVSSHNKKIRKCPENFRNSVTFDMDILIHVICYTAIL